MKKFICVFMILVFMTGCAGKSGTPEAVGEEITEEAASFTADDIDKVLQGKWSLGTAGSFFFADGKVSLTSGGTTMNGDYSIDMEAGNVDCVFPTSDGKATIHIPFVFDGTELTMTNNQGAKLSKE